MAQVTINCKNCLNDFIAKSRKAEYCCFECRAETVTRSKGTLGRDYIICELCNRSVVSVSGIHMRTYHKEYTIDRYKMEFPDSLLSAPIVLVKKGIGGKKGGDRMREDSHRERLSNNAKGENNPMHRTKTTKDFRKSISPFSPEFYKKRSPELSDKECEDLAKTKIGETKVVSHTQVSYWKDKGFTQEEAKSKISELQKTFSLEICIEKFGLDEGTKKWKDRQSKWKDKVFNENTHIGGGRSMIGEVFISELIKLLDPLNFTLLYGKNEKFIKTKENKAFKYDFTISEFKLIFEFNGDYWHCNPLQWKATDLHKVKNLHASEIWLYDSEKKSAAISHGYEVITIWESDYNKDPTKKIEECKELINEKIKEISKESNIQINKSDREI